MRQRLYVPLLVRTAASRFPSRVKRTQIQEHVCVQLNDLPFVTKFFFQKNSEIALI